jgi:hypothetical protein
MTTSTICTTNEYELLFLTNRKELEKHIASVVKKALNKEEGAKEELIKISKYIVYSVEIEDNCSFECDNPYITGSKTFSSVEHYEKKREDYWSADDASNNGVDFVDGTEFGGCFSWDNDPSVSVDVDGLGEDASKEAQVLWEQKWKQDQLEWKKGQLLKAQQEVEELEVVIASAQLEVLEF